MRDDGAQISFRKLRLDRSVCIQSLDVSAQNVTGYILITARLRLKCEGTRAETRFRLSAKRTSTLKSAGASVQSTTDSRSERISGSNAGYSIFRGSVKSTGYPLHSKVSPFTSPPCVTVCHHVSTGLYPVTWPVFFRFSTVSNFL